MAQRPHSKTQDVWDAFLAGEKPLDIAARLNLANQTVYNLLTKGRRHGVLPISERYTRFKTKRRRLYNAHLKYGKTSDVVERMTDAQLDWVIDQCSTMRIATLDEFFLELVRDAYEEDTARKRTKNQ